MTGAAAYALCLGYRIRFVLDLNAREAMQLDRAALRPRGPSVLPRRRARDAPPDRPGPPRGRRRDDPRGPEAEPRLERILAEMRTQARLDGLTAG